MGLTYFSLYAFKFCVNSPFTTLRHHGLSNFHRPNKCGGMKIYCNKTLLKKAQFSRSTEIVFNDRYIKKIEGKHMAHIHLMVYELNILCHRVVQKHGTTFRGAKFFTSSIIFMIHILVLLHVVKNM